MRHNIARNAADGGYTRKFVARNVAEVGRNSIAAILRATILGVHRVSGPLDEGRLERCTFCPKNREPGYEFVERILMMTSVILVSCVLLS